MQQHFNSLSLHLRRDDTIGQRLFGKYDCLSWNHCKFQNQSVQWMLKILAIGLTLVAGIIGAYTENIILGTTTNTLIAIMLLSLIVDCNFVVFVQCLKSYQIYYKTINVTIAIIAICIDSHFAKKYFPQYNVSIRIIWCITFIIDHTLAIFSMSLVDGYHATQRVRLIAVMIPLLYFVYLYVIIYFGILRSYKYLYNLDNNEFKFYNTKI